MRDNRIGDISIPIRFKQIVESVNLRRQLREQPLLPEDMTEDNLRITFNSEEYRPEMINISFLGHLQYDILIPYPSNAWMGSILPDEAFEEVHSVNYYQKINGDCELTHAIEDLYRVLKPGGKAVIAVPNFKYILEKIIETRSEQGRLQWEHFLFSRNVDERGLFYNQSITDFSRLRNRGLFAGFTKVEEDQGYGEEVEKYLTMIPEEFNLPGVTSEVRRKFQRAKRIGRRTKCIIARCSSKAGQQEFKRAPSIYCRRHYRKAKTKLAQMQERALRIAVILTK